MLETIQQNFDQIQFQNIQQKDCNCQYNMPKINLEKKETNLNYSQEQLCPPIAVLNSQFYLLKKIGAGSSGAVYLSYSKDDPKRNLYAIKILPQTEINSDFMNSCEVNYLSKINHKNILKIHSHGIGKLQLQNGFCQQVYYIIMDYLNHGSLLAQINNNIGLGEDYSRLLFAQLLDGLEAIHNSNLVHRDIKLDNIMISGDDYTLKYIDFGFATEKSNGFLTTFLGTPNYAAPELHLKQPYLGVSEDIFSLGVTLFILVTGHLPFLLPLPNDILYRHIFCVDYINYWRKRNIKVSPSFMELFDNLVAFDPSQRPSISEIRQSKWMKEINWGLKDQLRNELIRREQNQLNINQRLMMVNNKERNGENLNMNNKNEKARNVDEILAKIKERKKIEVVNDIKKQLFPTNLNNNLKIEKEEKCYELDIKTTNSTSNNLKGFIQINANIKNMNSLMLILKSFLKNEGFNITKRDLVNSKLEISNGEVDVLLFFEKMYKIIKISFSIINGNKDDFINFKKLMKKFNIKEE